MTKLRVRETINMAASSAVSRRRSPLAVSVVEDHDEALHVIYRAIGSRKLPLEGNTLVHFDAHPDLLSPELPADDFWNKERLFEAASIAEWILPAVFMGHIGSVVWLKPPWSQQMADGDYCLVVGKEKSNGCIRVATPLDYFISGQLYTDADSLSDLKSVPLHVLTLPVWEEQLQSLTSPSLPPLLASGESLPPLLASGESLPPLLASGESLPPLLARAERKLSAIPSSRQPWILDIDLDFFSTANPFRDHFSEEEYRFLEKLYKFQGPLETSRSSVSECVRNRGEQVASLQSLWTEKHSNLMQSLTTHEQKLVLNIKEKIGRVYNDEDPFQAHDIHVAGLMTDLPHNPATQSEVVGLMASVSHLLQTLFSSKHPSLVTIARSTEDGYTPAEHVEQLQQEVVGVVTRLSNDIIAFHNLYSIT